MTLILLQGPLIQEVRQEFAPWLYQVCTYIYAVIFCQLSKSISLWLWLNDTKKLLTDLLPSQVNSSNL